MEECLHVVAALGAVTDLGTSAGVARRGHDREAYAVDAIYVRVRAHGTRSRGGYAAQAVGWSRGGLSSKVHLLVDTLGRDFEYGP